MPKLRKIKKWFNDNLKLFLYLFLLLSILVGIWLIYTSKFVNISHKIQYFGFVFSSFGILYTGLMVRFNHDWHRRQLATKVAKEIRIDLKNDLKILNEQFDYFRLKETDLITVDDIHSKICKKNDDGSFVYVDGKLIVDYDGRGLEVKDAISSVLNSYEYVAAGVYEGAFDRSIIKVLFGGNLIKCHGLFEEYIKHMNEDMRPERLGKIWCCLKQLAKEFKEEEMEEKYRPKERKRTA